MVLLIDNYDSFTFNLYQMIGALAPEISVVRNDQISVEQAEALAPSQIIISPGPGRPEDSGVCPQLIRHFAGRTPLLGVCLGHQAICQVFGATIGYAPTLMHGKTSTINLSAESRLFSGLPSRIEGGRYHSLIVEAATLPPELVVTAGTAAGEVMAVEHRDYPLFGVQFHPESILSPQGDKILANFLAIKRRD
jgi:anthranilate synthase component 2